MKSIIKIGSEEVIIQDSINIEHENKDKLLNDIKDEVLSQYINDDCNIEDILSIISVNNISIYDVVKLYANIYKEVENDQVVHIYEDGGYLDLAEDKQYNMDDIIKNIEKLYIPQLKII